jgi:hypothetical protein
MAQPVLKFEFPSFPDLQQAFQELPKGLRATTQAAAVKRAMLPCLAALKRNTAKGPTGNLQRSIAIKSIRYNNTGTGVAVVGFTKAGTGKSTSASGGKVRKGKDRAFHQFWIEFGTKERRITKPSALRKYVIASSYDSLGPFTLSRKRMAKGQRKVVQSNPKYPKAFFKAAARGEALVLAPVQAQQPIARTWAQTKGQVASRMESEMRQGLVNARKQMEIRAAKAAAKRAAASA